MSDSKLRFFCVPKEAFDAIIDYYDGQKDCATALTVFMALCRIANDKGSLEFESLQSYIAMKAGWET